MASVLEHFSNQKLRTKNWRTLKSLLKNNLMIVIVNFQK